MHTHMSIWKDGQLLTCLWVISTLIKSGAVFTGGHQALRSSILGFTNLYYQFHKWLVLGYEATSELGLLCGNRSIRIPLVWHPKY